MPQPLHQSIQVRRGSQWPCTATQMGFNEALKRRQVRRDRAKKQGLFLRGNQQGGKVLHLDRVDQIGFVFDVNPQESNTRELGLQLLEQRLVFPAGATPVRAQAGE